MDETVSSTFTGRCVILQYFYGCVCVGVTVQSTFMGECTFLEDSY